VHRGRECVASLASQPPATAVSNNAHGKSSWEVGLRRHVPVYHELPPFFPQPRAFEPPGSQVTPRLCRVAVSPDEPNALPRFKLELADGVQHSEKNRTITPLSPEVAMAAHEQCKKRAIVLVMGMITPISVDLSDIQVTSPWSTVGDELALALLRSQDYDCPRALVQVMKVHAEIMQERGVALDSALQSHISKIPLASNGKPADSAQQQRRNGASPNRSSHRDAGNEGKILLRSVPVLTDGMQTNWVHDAE